METNETEALLSVDGRVSQCNLVKRFDSLPHLALFSGQMGRMLSFCRDTMRRCFNHVIRMEMALSIAFLVVSTAFILLW
jgi:hypothetical protein